MIITKLSCFFILFLLIFIPDFAFSESVRIATVEMPPFGFFAEDGKSTGVLYEISNKIAEEAGFSYTNIIVPFPRLINELEMGAKDCGIFLESSKHDKIALKVAFILPLENVVIGRKGTDFKFLSDLHGKTVATVRNAKYDTAFTADKNIQKYQTNGYEQSIQMVISGRLDAMIGPSMGLLFTEKRMGYSKDMFGKALILNTKNAYMQYSLKSADKKKTEALKAATERLHKNGIIQEIINKYSK
ncbi:ABC transporter substrate-binding protein [Desulfopila sp. IMCC35008]|uniref:substrate-binding periplasmic protein n=1 Tax=Desulfopila sp. IMCC35008 TaxID=2653858 RepID=UPI0013D4C300|nr:transporter substrate-binding domain-containing protein [Desulfopila sp. IMCC35008]